MCWALTTCQILFWATAVWWRTEESPCPHMMTRCSNSEVPKPQFLGSTQLFLYNLNPNPSSSKESRTYYAKVIFQLIQLNKELLCVQVKHTESGVRMLHFKSWLRCFLDERPWAIRSICYTISSSENGNNKIFIRTELIFLSVQNNACNFEFIIYIKYLYYLLCSINLFKFW